MPSMPTWYRDEITSIHDLSTWNWSLSAAS
jgi:hypothetical protein